MQILAGLVQKYNDDLLKDDPESEELITLSQLEEQIEDIAEDLVESIKESIDDKIDRWINYRDIVNYDIPGNSDIESEVAGKVVRKTYELLFPHRYKN